MDLQTPAPPPTLVFALGTEILRCIRRVPLTGRRAAEARSKAHTTAEERALCKCAIELKPDEPLPAYRIGLCWGHRDSLNSEIAAAFNHSRQIDYVSRGDAEFVRGIDLPRIWMSTSFLLTGRTEGAFLAARRLRAMRRIRGIAWTRFGRAIAEPGEMRSAFEALVMLQPKLSLSQTNAELLMPFLAFGKAHFPLKKDER